MHQYYLFFCLLLGNSPLWASQAVLVVKNLAAIAGDVRDVGSNPESEDPLEEGMPIHSIILAWRTHGQRNLASYGPLGRTESDMIEVT